MVETQVEHFIPNDLSLDPARRLLIVTGPNMGGKSTYMRQTAVIALLAYCGLFVPGERCARIGPLDAIYTRIGAADDLAGGRSTFMVEMTEAAYILNRATPQSLVLIDEIGRGTSTFDGLALAWAIARELALTNRSLTLFATHYFELTALPAELEGCANVHFDAVEHKDGIVFLHAVEDGPANQSYGLQVAQAGWRAGGSAVRRRAHVPGAARSVQRAARRQADLFAAYAPPPAEPAPADAPLLDRLTALDPDALSPRDAHARSTNSSVWRDDAVGERSLRCRADRKLRERSVISGGGRARRARGRAPSLPTSPDARRAPCSRSAGADQPADGCRRRRPCRRRYRSPCTRAARPHRRRPARVPFELHADLDLGGKPVLRLDPHQFGVVFAECVFGLERDRAAGRRLSSAPAPPRPSGKCRGARHADR